MNLYYSSKVSKRHRPALEELLFFNPRQSRVRDGIVDSLEHFGHPRLEEGDDDNLSVHIGDQETQTLYAYDLDAPSGAPVGVVVFQRTSPAEMAIIHVAVNEDYSFHGRRGGPGLGALLVEKVREICSRIVGVQRIVFFYRQEVVIRVPA